MRRVTPKAFLIGESQLDEEAIGNYLVDTYGGQGDDWYEENVGTQRGAASDSELITEVMGRLCYQSFAPGINKNVTKIRKGNEEYLKHIIEVGHGSVLEHGSTSWILRDVSRVFTHELVRHRAGVAVSQESLRYVRMDNFGLWIPNDPALTPEIVKACETQVGQSELFCTWLSKQLGLDDPGRSMDYKKVWTSFIRRFAPQGMSTSIGITINFRALRHVIVMRTAKAAEAEIRLVFDEIAKIAVERWPSLFQDFGRSDQGEWVTEHSKI